MQYLQIKPLMHIKVNFVKQMKSKTENICHKDFIDINFKIKQS